MKSMYANSRNTSLAKARLIGTTSASARRAFCIGTVILLMGMCVGATTKKKTTPQEANDSITQKVDSVGLKAVNNKEIDILENKQKWSDLYAAWKLGTLEKTPACLSVNIDKDQAYVFHIAHWAGGGVGKPPSLVSSSWSAYGTISKSKKNEYLYRRLATNGDPLIYGKKRVLLIGVDVFDDLKPSVQISYKTSVTQTTPENVQALWQLVSTIVGLQATTKASESSILIAIACQDGTKHLPYQLNVVETIAMPQPGEPDKKGDPGNQPKPQAAVVPQQPDGEARQKQPTVVNATYRATTETKKVDDVQPKTLGQQETGTSDSNNSKPSDGNAPKGTTNTPAAGVADCSGLTNKTNCTVSRTFTSLDKEWWDVSLAVPIPGVKESTYSISQNSLQSKTKTHTDLYALFDIYYPTSNWFTKGSPIPHITVGIPVTSQPFYRPEFGLSENLTGWTTLEKKGFPVSINFFAGLVYMNTTVVKGSPTTVGELTADSSRKRVWKPIFGIEVPVSSLISKVGKSSKNQNTNAGGGNATKSQTAN